jgi:NAD(P)-dependent dehydrogenase (short-subunit alcohol dehydrogenase family)
MNEQALWLDGNALAGLLEELFATELTDAPHGCGACGAVRAIGAHRLYRGAGLVLRCPVFLTSRWWLRRLPTGTSSISLAHGEWRFPAADEIAAAAIYLASDYADYVHGTTLTVDGGRLAVRSARPIGR